MKIFYFQQWLSVSYCWSMWSVPKRTISWLNWLRSKFFQSHNCRIWHWWKTCKSIIVNDQTIVCWIPYFNKARVCHIKSTNQYSISNSPPQCRSQQSCRRRNATLLHANVILLLLSLQRRIVVPVRTGPPPWSVPDVPSHSHCATAHRIPMYIFLCAGHIRHTQLVVYPRIQWFRYWIEKLWLPTWNFGGWSQAQNHRRDDELHARATCHGMSTPRA